ncbi:MAG: CvpA family protein [Epulopiscium sp.]|nr:CvpA family protein [Candidatus Epulonipiscium sp.]
MNKIDLIIIAVIIISGVTAYFKGFLYTIFKTLSTLLSLYLSYRWYQPINNILKGTPLYGWLQKLAISNVAGLQGAMGLNDQTRLINSLNLPVPEVVKEGLVYNNNPEIYKLLGVDNFAEYVAGYIANFYLSIIAYILLLAVIKSIMHIIGGSIKGVSRMPVISFFDRWLGLSVGLVKGVIGVWIATIIMAVMIVFPRFNSLAVLLSQSTLAKWFYENNLILDIIDQIFI